MCLFICFYVMNRISMFCQLFRAHLQHPYGPPVGPESQVENSIAQRRPVWPSIDWYETLDQYRQGDSPIVPGEGTVTVFMLVRQSVSLVVTRRCPCSQCSRSHTNIFKLIITGREGWTWVPMAPCTGCGPASLCPFSLDIFAGLCVSDI